MWILILEEQNRSGTLRALRYQMQAKPTTVLFSINFLRTGKLLIEFQVSSVQIIDSRNLDKLLSIAFPVFLGLSGIRYN